MMLMQLPIVLACLGFQSCPAVAGPDIASPRPPSPAAVVTHRPWDGEPTLRASSSLRSSIERAPMPAALRMSRAGTQPPLRMERAFPASKAMYMCALATVGAYAGAFLGAAIGEDSGDSPGLRGALIGMPVGAVVGGILGWKLVR